MPVLLQSPDDETEKAPLIPRRQARWRKLAPPLVWQDETKLSIGGQSRGGVRVTVSENGTFFGDAPSCRWRLAGDRTGR